MELDGLVDRLELGVGMGSGLGYTVVDPRLAAPRGDEHTNAYLQKLEWADRGVEFGDSDDDLEDIPRATLETHIPEENLGYKLLLKMGWSRGKGLGRNEDGALTVQSTLFMHEDMGIAQAVGHQ